VIFSVCLAIFSILRARKKFSLEQKHRKSMKTNRLQFLKALILLVIINMIPISGLAQADLTGFVQETPPFRVEQITAENTIFIPVVLQPPGKPSVFGVEMESDWNGLLLDLASQAGVNWVRRNGIEWQLVEVVEGTRDWAVMAALESEMTTLSQNDIELVLIVRGVPDWAQTEDGNICGPIAQPKFVAFASFLSELVSRYSQPPYNVRYWEIGNEPDFPYSERDIPFGCWGDASDPYYGGGYYGEMLKVVYPSIKAADPDAQVLVGGLLMDCDPNNPPPDKDCTSTKFLEGILLAGAGSAFDGVSFHAYDYYNGTLGSYCNPNWQGSSTTTGPILDLKASFLNSVLEQYGHSHKYLMNTENALLCNNYHCDDTFEMTKAIYVAQSYAESLASKVSTAIWYSYTGSWQATNLVEGSNNPKRAYYAFQAASQILRDTKFTQKIQIEGLTVYEFYGRGDRKWILWSTDGQPQHVLLPELPVHMWDLLGKPVTPTRELDIGVLPVYLEWAD